MNNSACTRYAWSTVGYPTLFISQDRTKCDCKYSINESEYVENLSPGSVKINGTDSYFSLAVSFTRLIEFQVDAKQAKSNTDFNTTKACDSLGEDVDLYNPLDLSDETLDWMLADDGSTLVGNYSDFSFSITVS